MSDDAAQLRRRQADARAALEALQADEGQGSAALVAQVFSGGAIPTTVPKVFLTHPIGVACDEAAGAAPTVTVGGETVPVLVLGPGVPVAGDRLVARQVEGRWVASSLGTPEPPPATCSPCSLPRQDLTLTYNFIGDSSPFLTCPTATSQVITTPLVYQGTVPSIEGFTTDVWRSPCLALRTTIGTWSTGYGFACFEATRFELVCKRSSVVATSVLYLIGFRAMADCDPPVAGHFAVQVWNPNVPLSTCDPLHVLYGPGVVTM